jgi:hypothetical protein
VFKSIGLIMDILNATVLNSGPCDYAYSLAFTLRSRNPILGSLMMSQLGFNFVGDVDLIRGESGGSTHSQPHI